MNVQELYEQLNRKFDGYDGEPRAWMRSHNGGHIVEFQVYGYTEPLTGNSSEDRMCRSLFSDVTRAYALGHVQGSIIWRRKPEFSHETVDGKVIAKVTIRVAFDRGTLQAASRAWEGVNIPTLAGRDTWLEQSMRAQS